MCLFIDKGEQTRIHFDCTIYNYALLRFPNDNEREKWSVKFSLKQTYLS